MNPCKASRDMANTMEYTKKASSRYFTPRSMMSNHLGARGLRLNRENPVFHEHSETAATGQIHEQNERRNRSDTTSMVTKTTTAAGWMVLIPSPLSQAESPSRPEMGKNPSIPSGRETIGDTTPLRTAATNW